MAKEPNPVNPDVTPAAAPQGMTREELFEALSLLMQRTGQSAAPTTEELSAIVATATAEAIEKTSGPGWDLAKFPNISTFNPLGEKDHPREELVGQIYWAGHELQKEELTAQEIALLNQIKPGRYQVGDVIVTVLNLTPGVPDARRLAVVFPFKSPDERAMLPRGTRRVSGMVLMLQEMLDPSLAVSA